jgi:glycosyltransferase involved in cell wall biosynthesis
VDIINTGRLVSIVVTTFNGERFLEKQLDSLCAQTYPNFEIIVVDDCSTDGTISILNRYAEKFSFITVHLNDQNLGYIKNFEKACLMAKGELISLCDQDDYWLPDKIKKLEAAIGDYPMIYCNSLLCDEELKSINEHISDRAVLKPITSCLEQAVFCRIYGHATLFTKQFFNAAYPFLTIIPHDWWLSYVATLNGGIQYLDEPLVYYRQHTSNIYGVVGSRRKKDPSIKKLEKRREISNIRARINAFAAACPDSFVKEKKVLMALAKSYQSFSLANNLSRVYLFFRYHKLLLAVKKRSLLRKYLFCLKMFFIIK